MILQTVSSTISDKRDDFHFEIVSLPFLDENVPRVLSYGVYISQLIGLAIACLNVNAFKRKTKF